jgi:hypothetical protein
MIMDPDDVPALVEVVAKFCTAVRNAKVGFVFVSEKFADGPVPIAAVTLYVPVAAEAVRVEETATPPAFVTAVHEFLAVPAPHAPPAEVTNLPVAPLVVGLVNVTVTPDTGFPLESVTRADNGAAKAVPVFADWLFPFQTVTFVGGPELTVVDADTEARPVDDAVST